MIKKNYLLLVFLALAGTFNASAKKISETEAAAEATKFCQMLIGGGNYHSVNSLSRVAFSSQPANPTYEDYYVFNIPDGGFVIIAGDNRMHKVLGYSDKGRIDAQNMPPQLEGMLKQYSLAVQSLPEDAPQHKSWTRGVELGDEVVLNTPTWNQWYPFNVKAPEFDNGAGQKERAPIGCVATATAIVMKYKGFPTKAIKDFEHTWYSNGTPYTVNYGEFNIDYSKLRDNYENLTEPLSAEEEKAIGDLMYAVAGIVNMQFDLFAGSSAYTNFEVGALREVFGFSSECQYIGRNYFSDEEWRNLIKEQIDNDCPIIYDGLGNGGHSFVCDGYNSEGYCHINWGWGGLDNGFFMIDDMNGYNQFNGMIINLNQDSPYDSSKYSRAWLCDGARGNIDGAGKAAGIQVTTNNIETGVPFNLNAAQFVKPLNLDGRIAVVLVDANDNIVEFAKDSNENNGSVEIFSPLYDDPNWWFENTVSFHNVHFTSPMQDDYKLALYTKETGEEDWKRLLGTISAPSSISVKGNTLELPELKVTVHGDASKVHFDGEIETNVMYGDWWAIQYKVEQGVAALYVNGRLMKNINDFGIGADWGEFIIKELYDIDIYYYPYSELLEKEYNVEVPGSLSSLVDKDEMKKIWKLRLTGELNHEDLYFLLDFPCLMHLDFENTHIVENGRGREDFIPSEVGNGYFMNKIIEWGLETCKLPKNLKGFEGWSLYPSNVESISIPATVDTYEDYAPYYPEYEFSINFIEVQNPVPVELKKGAIGKDLMPSMREKGILFVPVGSKSAYENHPSWQGFKEIIETSEPLIGEFVDDDNVRYLILNDCAAVSGVYGGVDVAEIKSTVEYNGKTYPVKYAVAKKLNAPNYLVINNEEAIDFKQNFASNVISPSLNPKFTNLVGDIYKGVRNFYVPGAYNAKDGYGDEFYKHEMWTYKINKKTGRLLVKSNYEEVAIKSVSINGKEMAPNANHVYEFEPTDNVTVSVVFEAFGSKPLTTVYDATFNAGLENEEIETGIINAINDDKGDVVVYTISGMKQKMKRSDLKHLPKGVYIINGKKYMVK